LQLVLEKHPQFCCSLGMMETLIETKEELNCIYDQYKNSSG
jgi:hypothetical protein